MRFSYSIFMLLLNTVEQDKNLLSDIIKYDGK